MKRTLLTAVPPEIPSVFSPILKGAALYDSSCSPEARVYFIDRDGGYYLKSAPKGSLGTEAALTRYFHAKGLATEVLEYLSLERDWLLTARVRGEDCTHATYLADPKRLCDLLATRLRELHETSFAGCPVPNRMDAYLATAAQNYAAGVFDASLFSEPWAYSSAEEAWGVLEANRHLLCTDTLLHGDYCLPNVMLDDWRFSAFIDLGNGGVGDRHVDLFWGAWTLFFNLKTDAYRDRFFDAYGRDRIESDLLRVVAAAEVFG